jgi:hypothetical protein
MCSIVQGDTFESIEDLDDFSVGTSTASMMSTPRSQSSSLLSSSRINKQKFTIIHEPNSILLIYFLNTESNGALSFTDSLIEIYENNPSKLLKIYIIAVEDDIKSA